ncbi:vacuolar membrane-associated protein iml1, partial [Irineochytrium annulatum]
LRSSTSTSNSAAPPPELPDQYYEIELLKRFGFVEDVEADAMFPPSSTTSSFRRAPYIRTQYVHRSGTAFVQILEAGKGFFWVNNRLHLTASSGLRGGVAGAGGGGGNNNATGGVTSTVGGVGAGSSAVHLAANGSGPAGSPAAASPSLGAGDKAASSQMNPDAIRVPFVATCSDAEALEQLWWELQQGRTSVTAMAVNVIPGGGGGGGAGTAALNGGAQPTSVIGSSWDSRESLLSGNTTFTTVSSAPVLKPATVEDLEGSSLGGAGGMSEVTSDLLSTRLL